MNTVQCEFWHEAYQTDDLLSQNKNLQAAFWFFTPVSLRSRLLAVMPRNGNHDIRNRIHENNIEKMTRIDLHTKNQWFLPFGVILDENPAYLRMHEGRCRHLFI